MLVIAALIVTGGALGGLTSTGDAAFDIALKFIASVVVVSLVIWCVVIDTKSWLRAATLFVAGAAVGRPSVAIVNPGAYGQGRSLGLTNHPNHLGFSMLLALGMAGGVAATRDLRQRIVVIASAPLLAWGVLASGSRAALLGLAISCVVVVALSRRVRTPALVAGSLIAVGLALALPGKIDSGPSALSRTLSPSQLEANSSAAHAANIGTAIDRIAERPLTGHGLADPLTYHSVPLQLVVIAGLFGMLAVLVAMIAAAKMISAASRPNVSLIGRSSAAGLFGALCALVVSNQFFDRYRDDRTHPAVDRRVGVHRFSGARTPVGRRSSRTQRSAERRRRSARSHTRWRRSTTNTKWEEDQVHRYEDASDADERSGVTPRPHSVGGSDGAGADHGRAQ